MTSPRRKSILTLTIGAGVAVVVVGGFLLVQDARHGWPFTRHHIQTAPGAASPRAAAAEAPTKGAARTAVLIDESQLAQLGVQFETVKLDRLGAGGRHPAVVTPDESRLSHIHTRVSGWVEQLHVSTGDRVRPGQALASVFSQELFASQTEYLSALQRSSATPGSAVHAAARTRLKVLGMSDADIERLGKSGTVQRLTTISSPRAGIVLNRGVTVGTAVDPSTELMTIADLSRVWALAEVPEAESSAVKKGSKAKLEFPSAGRASTGALVDFVYPTLTERTRSVRVRFAIDNSDGTLRPGVYGTVSFASSAREALTVPRDSLVETGESQHVFVRKSDGSLDPRAVKLGARVADRVEVLNGIEAGETIVTSGVFLIDSESRLRATGAAPAHGGHSKPDANESAPTKAPTTDSSHPGHGG
jgi:membrane fusion protein, copper/silver efflux system